MRTTTTLLLLAAALALTLASGCGAGAPQSPQAASTEPTATGPVLTRDTAMAFEPGTKWEYTAISSKGLSITLPLKGPWDLVPDSSVTATDYANEVVDLKTAPLPEQFDGAAFAVKSTDSKTGDVLYLYRSVADDAMMAHGRAEKGADGTWVPTVYEPPTVSYPFGLDVGDSTIVRESEAFTIKATAVARSQARTPAGVFEKALLVRYDFTKPDGSTAGPSVYWILSPGVDWVAYIVPKEQLKPDSDIGGIVQIDILTSLPSK